MVIQVSTPEALGLAGALAASLGIIAWIIRALFGNLVPALHKNTEAAQKGAEALATHTRVVDTLTKEIAASVSASAERHTRMLDALTVATDERRQLLGLLATLVEERERNRNG